ncbi:hypothetical protein [Candidatus Amarobacter glycogenicus]|uniref:hypothetical protein n=1 Tax=Candidatus Amarobacter glycogenicus TaxID=3140699 RepID=UPI00313478AC|nr:hypothetical protein [Dehalococcoidia bacterium]
MATATGAATPPSGPIYKGRPCGVGTLIHDFLIIQEPPPGPVAACLEQANPSASQRLYRLQSVPSGLVFVGVERDDRGHSFVVYKSVGDPDGSSTVQIVVTEGHRDPDPIILRDASAAAAADFLPVPGVAIRELANLAAMWHEDGRSYMLIIDGAKTALTLEQAAALLEPFTPAGPPSTGSGAAVAREGRAWPATAGVGVAVMGAGALLLLAWSRRQLNTKA